MAIDFRSSTITVPAAAGRRTIAGAVSFNTSVLRADIALNGFNLDFTSVVVNPHLNQIEADTDIVSIVGNVVDFQVQCNLADRDFLEPYSGLVNALVIAEVV